MKKVSIILLSGIIACSSTSKIARTSSSDIASNQLASVELPEATNSTTTPVSDPEMAKAAIMGSITAKRLTDGKKIYIQRCTKCHSMKDPANYTVQQWEPILRKMFVKARLTDEHDKELIRDYVIVRSK